MTEERIFKVEFEHWKEETGENICDFCEQNQVRWYCDFLVTGYCEKCMQEQIKEYERLLWDKKHHELKLKVDEHNKTHKICQNDR